MDVMNVIDKTCNAIRRKIAAFVNSISPKELVEIGEDTYYEESIIERDGRKYVLLRSIEDPSAIQVRRICEYYETVEDEAELRYAVKELMGQQAFTKRGQGIGALYLILRCSSSPPWLLWVIRGS